jgi:hypothetical protein
MKPRFKTLLAWEQAQLLMQPAFIRVLDNLRKQLETSLWKGSYEEIQMPYPGYLLCLTSQEHSVTVDLWDLCFQVCFLNYPSSVPEESTTVDIDTTLIDETGDVDWQSLESKAQHIVQQIFANLPANDV